MTPELRTLRNTMAVTQSVIIGGRQFTLPGHEEQTFDRVVADKFIEKCSPVVIDVADEVEQQAEQVDDTKYMWLANVTGNPEAPDQVLDRVYNKDNAKRWSDVKVKNPNKAPRTLKREELGGHQQYWAQDGGLVNVSLSSKLWEIRPFQRRRFPKATGNWFIGQDMVSGAGRGAVIASRPASAFEPDMSWTLDDMRTYLKIVSPDSALGPDEGQVAGLAKRKAEKSFKDKTPSEATMKAAVKEAMKEGLFNAKRDLFRILYFKLVDPAYNLPTRKEFQEYLTGRSDDDVSEDEIEKLMAAADATLEAAKPQASAEV